MSNKPNLQALYSSVDSDRSGEITADELQKALINGDYSHFSIETVRLMVDMFDQDQTGTISFLEFQALWDYIQQWQQCFRNFDRDNSNMIDYQELENALRAFGYNLSNNTISLAVRKFNKHLSKSARAQYRPELVNFDTFIRLCVTIKMVTENFRRFDNDSDGVIQIRYEDFLNLMFNSQ